MTAIRDKLQNDIVQIKAKPDYQGAEGFKNVKALMNQQKNLQKVVQKKNDACMDMLSFFKDKFKSKELFVQMVNDVGINQLLDDQSQEVGDNDLMEDSEEDDLMNRQM